MQNHSVLKEWMVKSQKGDHHAFERIFKETSPKLMPMLLAMLKSTHLAEEVLQDAFLDIWKNIQSYNSTKGEVLPWIFGVVRYRALDKLRSNNNQRYSELTDDIEAKTNVSAEVENRQVSNLLLKCMEALTSDQKDSLHSAFFSGFTHEEVALHLSKPLGSIKTWIRRGLSDLKNCLEAS